MDRSPGGKLDAPPIIFTPPAEQPRAMLRAPGTSGEYIRRWIPQTSPTAYARRDGLLMVETRWQRATADRTAREMASVGGRWGLLFVDCIRASVRMTSHARALGEEIRATAPLP